MAKTVSACPETPALGGKNQKSSRFCYDHQDLESSDVEPRAKKPHIILTINVVDQKVSSRVSNLTGEIPANDDPSVHVGCKKAENVPRFYNRTAGLMVLVKPCGVVVSISELLTCESSSQLFIQLLRMHCESNTSFNFLGYDRACEFAPFLTNLAKKGNKGAEMLLTKKYMVDRFHIKGHTTKECDINSPFCQFHPDLPKFDEILGTNTECAEQCFSWLGKFKHMVKYMTQYKYKFFIHGIVVAHNRILIQKRK